MQGYTICYFVLFKLLSHLHMLLYLSGFTCSVCTSSFFKCWFMCRKRYTHCFCLCMLFIHKILYLLMLYGTKQPFLCLHNTIRLLCIGSFKIYLHFLTAWGQRSYIFACVGSNREKPLPIGSYKSCHIQSHNHKVSIKVQGQQRYVTLIKKPPKHLSLFSTSTASLHIRFGWTIKLRAITSTT